MVVVRNERIFITKIVNLKLLRKIDRNVFVEKIKVEGEVRLLTLDDNIILIYLFSPQLTIFCMLLAIQVT